MYYILLTYIIMAIELSIANLCDSYIYIYIYIYITPVVFSYHHVFDFVQFALCIRILFQHFLFHVFNI